MGDTFEIERTLTCFVSGAVHDDPDAPSYETRSSTLLRASVVERRDERTVLDVVVMRLRTREYEYVRGAPQRNLRTGASEEPDPGLKRQHRCEMDEGGRVVEAGRDPSPLQIVMPPIYNLLTGALVEVPREASRWSCRATLPLGSCVGSLDYELNCRVSRTQDGYHDVTANARSVGEPLAGQQLGSGRWRISPDLRTVEGALDLLWRDSRGGTFLRWRDEVATRPVRP